MIKTNALRILEQRGVKFDTVQYPDTLTSGVLVARAVGADEKTVFKTLVTRSNELSFLVFVIPCNLSLDLKKAAAGVKRVEMVAERELFPLTGYVHGGCSPVGMKKKFAAFFDKSGEELEKIYVSAGRIGLQMIVNPRELAAMLGAAFSPLT